MSRNEKESLILGGRRKRVIKKPKKYNTTESEDDRRIRVSQKKINVDDLQKFVHESEADEDDSSECDVVEDTINIETANKENSDGEKQKARRSMLPPDASDDENDIINLFENLKKHIDKKMDDLEITLFNKIENTKLHLQSRIKEIEKMLNNGQQPISVSAELPDGFPLGTKEDFLNFENDTEKRSKMLNYFVFLSAPDPDTAIRTFIKETINNDLLKIIKWVKEEKENESLIILFKTNYAKILYKTLNIIFPNKNVNVNNFNNMMIKGIRAAKQRMRDRDRRDSRTPSASLQQSTLHVMTNFYESNN